MHEFLLFNSIMCFIVATGNFAYYWVHANGKKYVRLFSSVILYTFAFGFILTYNGYIPVEIFGHNFLNGSFVTVAVIPLMDTIIDWRSKIREKARGIHS